MRTMTTKTDLFSTLIRQLAWSLALLLPALAVQAQTPPEDFEDAAAENAVDYFARDTYRIDTMACPFKSDIEYDPGDIECGLLQVPENREDPHSRFIELHFVKLNSTWDDEEEAEKDDDEEDSGLAPGKRDDPVIYLTGGPGAPAQYYVDRFKDHRIRKHRDLYILEQRGIVHSGDFCTKYSSRKPERFDVETHAEQRDAGIERANDCAMNATAAGVDLTAYNSIENARDVHALRRALGLEQWNIWGISYGSILGQAYIKEDPEGIRAIVLDAIVPINARDESLFWRVVNWYDRDLQKLDALCQANDDCAKTYPNLGQRVRDAAKTLVDNPIVVETKDTELYPSGKAHFFTDIAAFLPFIFFYEQDNYPGLPGLIYAWADIVERRDENYFKMFAEGDGGGLTTISQGMYDAIFCMDGYAEAQVASAAADYEEFPILGSAVGSPEDDLKRAQRCHDMGMSPRDSSEYAPVQTDIPALLVEGDMDPITPPPLAKTILPGFSNGTYVEFPYAGHGPSRSVECAGDMLNKFFDDPTAEPDLSCVDEMEIPDFYVPMFVTSIGPRLASIAIEDKKKLAGPIAWFGVSTLFVLIAFIFLSLAPIGRRIDNRQAAPTDGARWAAWTAATLGFLAIAIIGAAFGVTYDASKLMVIFGLVSWAKFGAFAGLLAGIAGIAAVALTVRSRIKRRLPFGTLVGFILTGLSAIGLSSFLMVWDLGPF